MTRSNNPNTFKDYGGIVMIDTSRRTKSAEMKALGIKKPWEYLMTVPEIRAFLSEFPSFINGLTQDKESTEAFTGFKDRARRSNVPPSGYVHVYPKPTGVEIYLKINATSTYTSEKRWKEIGDTFQSMIQAHLGNDAYAYISEYEPGHYGGWTDEEKMAPENRCYELRADFEVKIYFREYLPIRDASRALAEVNMKSS